MEYNLAKPFEAQAPRTLKEVIELCRGASATVDNARQFEPEEASALLPQVKAGLMSLHNQIEPLERELARLRADRFALQKVEWALELASCPVTKVAPGKSGRKEKSNGKKSFEEKFSGLSLAQMQEKIKKMEEMLASKKG